MNALKYLGDVLGSLRYLGRCAICRIQFMSTHDRVLQTDAGILCERCAARVKPKP
jgi:DNA-directed RNA polymerase subunit RPC12/RpoP